ncbi:MAG: CRTAC1 family protein [Bacteroidetes bacterium]|nr:MAG: CRTAC1 family protein [Bacteroidota bacterium]
MRSFDWSVNCWSVFIVIGLLFFSSQLEGQSPENEVVLKNPFVEAHDDFPGEDKNLRKWDAPVVADLDQDGHLDLLLNDHGFGMRVCWNNNGKFAKPYDIIMGDLHGISVGDFDDDGLLEVIASRGGGSGSNARNSKMYRVGKNRSFTALPDFYVPLELMRGRTVKFWDFDKDGDLDLLNFAFPSKEKKGKSENYIYENDGNGQLILSSNLPFTKSDGQKTLITDLNGDHIPDLVLYGHGRVRAFHGNGDLTFNEVTDKVFPDEIERVTGIVELDYDNDGDFDLYFTRGKGFEKGETFYDPDTKIWAFHTSRGDFNFDNLVMGDIMNIENLQSQWPNKDVYLGETGYDYEFPGETHSGRDIRLVNSDALGFPDELPKKGTYIGYVGNRAWRIAGNIWSPSTGIVRNVEDYPKYDHPEGLEDILLENRNGKFKEVTSNAGLLMKDHTTGAAVADFDNNGFLDLLVLRRGDLIHANEAIIFLNTGEGKFERLIQHSVSTNELGAIGMTPEVLDYNKDGKMDIVFGHERGKWHLFRNTVSESETGNFLKVEVGNSPKNRTSPLGAIVVIEINGKKQFRRVGSTGSVYGLSYDTNIHFGLGNHQGEVQVSITWTNGERHEKKITHINSTIPMGASSQK